jgi:hypothetical protein
MSNPQVKKLVERILKEIPGTRNLESAFQHVRDELETYGILGSMDAALQEAQEIVKEKYSKKEIIYKSSIISEIKPKWYTGPDETAEHWPALRQYMLNEKNFSEKNVESIDETSTEIVSLMRNPVDGSNPKFKGKGLVLGYVQSGKTANMTAVIAKAVDAGYNFVIILAGLTNKLRWQTQMRIRDDLVKRVDGRWVLVTSNEVDGDFEPPPNGGFPVLTDCTRICVIKKNVTPLRKLKKTFERSTNHELSQYRVLIIDDECDQASVNSASGELNITAINNLIRQLLNFIPSVQYVGYTATPFANVLINPYQDASKQLDDLYPSDFITSLPRPEGYFGTERLFGVDPEDPASPNAEEEALDVITDVPEEDSKLLQPAKAGLKDSFYPQLAGSLEDAVLYFLACCAARGARGHADEHMTMLVHTSAYVVMHERTAELIADWIEAIQSDLLDPSSEVGTRLAALWESECGRVPADLTTEQAVVAEVLFEHLPEVLERLEVLIENGSSTDRISYSEGPDAEHKAKTYIVVGGTILARGLTLEGLMVSYFLRTASQYDTLLQMGRWFGYRPGYEDLPRIWMPSDLSARFRSLAGIEREIRDEIERYRSEERTPMEIAVRIRTLPGMAITAANKMRHARKCDLSYWGAHRQTTRFRHLEKDLLDANWQAGTQLLESAASYFDPGNPMRKLWKGVPKSLILPFIEDYRFHPDQMDLDPKHLGKFIEQDDPRLAFWNVGVVHSGRTGAVLASFGPAGEVGLISRARLKGYTDKADIKALMSKQDVVFDCADTSEMAGNWAALKDARAAAVGAVPLLLLYPIDRKSEPSNGSSKTREPLDAATDVLGVGIVFPGSSTEDTNYVSVEIRSYSADELAEIESEDQASAEAAGV